MRHIDTLFDDPYLKAGCLEGKDLVATIDRVQVQEVGSDKDRCPVVFFREFKKGLGLNKTNAKRIRNLYGADVDQWPGKRVTLYPSETDFGGQTVDCLRVRPEAPAEDPT